MNFSTLLYKVIRILIQKSLKTRLFRQFGYSLVFFNSLIGLSSKHEKLTLRLAFPFVNKKDKVEWGKEMNSH